MPINPPRDCPICPRLAAFVQSHRPTHPDWHNAPVENFGDENGRLLIVGLAPGLRGANRTGRPFTGDYAGDLLYQMLGEFGFARGAYGATPTDGLSLHDVQITNAVRCVPPGNKPVGAEINACRPFLTETITAMPNLKVILSLGRIAHDSLVRTLGQKPSALPFGHNRVHQSEQGLYLVSSYHCSRYNTNTGRLTEDMFRAVFVEITKLIQR